MKVSKKQLQEMVRKAMEDQAGARVLELSAGSIEDLVSIISSVTDNEAKENEIRHLLKKSVLAVVKHLETEESSWEEKDRQEKQEMPYDDEGMSAELEKMRTAVGQRLKKGP